MRWKFFLLAMAAAAMMSPAQAKLVVSKKATKNVDCEAGVCIANGHSAVLNVNDLESMLIASDVTLQSGSHAKDIQIDTALDWASTRRLTLDSFGAIDFERPVTVNGTGAVTLTTNDGGSIGALSFGAKGKLTFRDTSSSLIINGAAYVLAADIATLAADIEAQSSGNFALASDYDASPDGTYLYTPIDDLGGNFEGLGNTISHFKLIDTHTSNENTALFFSVSGSLSDLRLSKVKVKGTGRGLTAALVGDCFGTISNVEVDATVEGSFAIAVGGICGDLFGTMTGSHSSGSVTGERSGTHAGIVGGLVGYNGGSISRSYSTADVTGVKSWIAGGLVGESAATIDRSFATGAVRLDEGVRAGGLVGWGSSGSVTNSYATGFTGGNADVTVGGLIGANQSAVTNSYASGAVAAGSNSLVGGLIGNDTGTSDLTDTYWDITTSGQSHGVGNNTAYPGVTGLTTEQFQAGLPAGFDPQIWAENPSINGGLPYLLSNPQD